MTVTLSDDGGQPVEEYNVSHILMALCFLTPLFEYTHVLSTHMYVANSVLSTCQVTINGTVMTFSGSVDLPFIGNVTGLSLMNGVTYTVSVVEGNSVALETARHSLAVSVYLVSRTAKCCLTPHAS